MTRIVFGGSIAAATAAQSLRAGVYDGQVTVLSEEPHPPYSRVLLSRGVPAGRESVESALLPLPSKDIEFRTRAQLGIRRGSPRDPEKRVRDTVAPAPCKAGHRRLALRVVL